MTARAERWAVAAVLALFTALALVHAWRLPAFEGPDEPGNLLYVQYLALERHLPAPSLEPTPELEVLDRGILPPLWFAAVAPLALALGADAWRATPALNPGFLRPPSQPLAVTPPAGTDRLQFLHGLDESDAVANPALFQLRVLRASAIPFALLALFAVWRAATAVAALAAPTAVGRRRFALGALALAAATPQLQHLSGTLTMDLAVAAFGACALAAAARWLEAADVRAARRHALAAGLWAGLAALTKLNGLVLLPALALAALGARVPWAAHRLRGRAGLLALAAIAVLAVAGPWYAWGFLETGHPLWPWQYQQASPFHNPAHGQSTDGTALWASRFVLVVAMTWLGDFAWLAVWLPLPAIVLAVALFAGASGIAIARAVGTSERAERLGAWVAALAAVALAATWVEPWHRIFGTGEVERWGSYAALAAALGALAVGSRATRRAASPTLSVASNAPAAPTAAPPDCDEPTARRTLRFLVACAALIFAAELYFNRSFNQPQARHLYPFLPALVVPVAIGLSRVQLLWPAVVLHAVLSLFALLLVERHLRPPGWNASPLFHATDVLRRGGDDGEGPLPTWVAPPAGARLLEPPVLTFEDPAGGRHEMLIGADNPQLDERRWRPRGALLRTSRDVGAALEGVRFDVPIPAGPWQNLAPGTRIDAEVLRLDESGATIARSARLTFHKAP